MNSERHRMFKVAGRYSALGIEMSVAVLLGTLVGNWVDEKWGTEPWGLVIGGAVGMGAAAQAVIRAVKSFRKSMEEKKDE